MTNYASKSHLFCVVLTNQCCVWYPLQKLVSLFNFHNYDNLRHFVKKQDPRRQERDERVCCILHLSVHLVCKSDKITDMPFQNPPPPLQDKSIFSLMFAAYSGDVSALRRCFSRSIYLSI